MKQIRQTHGRGPTGIKDELAEEGQDILYCFLRRDFLEKLGHIFHDERSVDDLLAPAKEVNFFERGEATVVKYEIIDDVYWDAGINVICAVGTERDIIIGRIVSHERGGGRWRERVFRALAVRYGVSIGSGRRRL